MILKVTEASTSDLNPDSDNRSPAMDPNTHVEYARLRLETSNIMVTLKRECEIRLKDPGATIEDKTNYVKEKGEECTAPSEFYSGPVNKLSCLSKDPCNLLLRLSSC